VSRRRRQGQGRCEPSPPCAHGFESPLIFTNYDYFTRELLERIDEADPRPTTVVIDCDDISETDTTGSGALHESTAGWSAPASASSWPRVQASVLQYLKRDGALKDLGADAVYEAVGAAHPFGAPTALALGLLQPVRKTPRRRSGKPLSRGRYAGSSPTIVTL
jgi:hypothetical protein